MGIVRALYPTLFATIVFVVAALRDSLRRKEEFLLMFIRHLFLSAQAHLGNVPAIIGLLSDVPLKRDLKQFR